MSSVVPRAPDVASSTAGASAGAIRSARLNRNAASSTDPATNAARPASSSAPGIRHRRRRGLHAGLGVPEPEGDRRGDGGRSGRGLGRRPRVTGRAADVGPGDRFRVAIEQRRRGRRRLGGIAGPDAGPGHAGEDEVDRAARPGQCASVARRRASVGRPRAAAASAAMTRTTTGPSSSRSAALAASPAPSRSPVRQRTSARSTSPSMSRRPIPAIVSSSDASQRQRPQTQVRLSQDEFQRPGPGPLFARRAPVPSCRQPEMPLEPPQVARRRDDREAQVLLAEERCLPVAAPPPRRPPPTATSASSSVRTRSCRASWPPIHDATWRVSSIRSSESDCFCRSVSRFDERAYDQ